MDAAMLLLNLYDAVRNLQQAADGCKGFQKIANTIGGRGEAEVMRAWQGLACAVDAAAPFAAAADRVFAECCKPAAVQAETTDAVNVPEVQPCYQGPVTCCRCGKLASCYAEYTFGNLCMKCNGQQVRAVHPEDVTHGG